jgi:6-phosphofructokinase 1
MTQVVAKIEEREKCSSKFSIIVVSEGALELGGTEHYINHGDRNSPARLGGVGDYLRAEIERHTGKETRAVVLGHLQRGGRPNAFDRMLATSFGAHAMRALIRGETGMMVALQASHIITVPLADAIQKIKTVPPDGNLVRTARDCGISFGAPDEDSHHERCK